MDHSTRTFGRPHRADDAGPGRGLRPSMLRFQEEHRRRRATRILGIPGKRDAATFRRLHDLEPHHGLVETAVLQQIEGGNARGVIHGQEPGTGVGLTAGAETADGCQYPANHPIVPGGDGLATGPVMDASARDVEQIAELFPRQAGSPPNFQDGLSGGFRRHLPDLPDRTRARTLDDAGKLTGAGSRRFLRSGGGENSRDGDDDRGAISGARHRDARGSARVLRIV